MGHGHSSTLRDGEPKTGVTCGRASRSVSTGAVEPATAEEMTPLEVLPSSVPTLREM